MLDSPLHIRHIVTHINPDMDAVISAYLLWRAAGHPEGIEFVFVPPGGGGDSNLNDGWFVVDTGRGRFDHHQERSQFTSAAAAVFSWLRPRLSEAEYFVASLFVAKAQRHDSGNARNTYSADPFEATIAEAFSTSALLQAYLFDYVDAENRWGSGTRDSSRDRSSIVMKKMLNILRYLFDRKIGHFHAKKSLDQLEEWVSPCSRVVLLKGSDNRHTKLEEGIGRKVVVYYSQSGTMGLVRTKLGSDLNLKAFAESKYFQKLFNRRKSEEEEWFVHKLGQSIIRKKFDETYNLRDPSIVRPKRLAEAVTEWMTELSS